MLEKTSLIATIFIALLTSGTVAAAAVAVADEKIWSYSQERNPVSGGIIYRAQAELTELRASVSCSTVNPLIEVRFFLNRDTLENFERVRWQFDNTRSRSDKWPRSANGRSLILPRQSRDPFLNQLKAYNALSMTIVSANGDEILFEIPLSGSSAAISRVLERCS
jgi:hypothetical protein